MYVCSVCVCAACGYDHLGVTFDTPHLTFKSQREGTRAYVNVPGVKAPVQYRENSLAVCDFQQKRGGLWKLQDFLLQLREMNSVQSPQDMKSAR